MLTRQWCVGHAGGVYMKLVYEEVEDLMETLMEQRHRVYVDKTVVCWACWWSVHEAGL